MTPVKKEFYSSLTSLRGIFIILIVLFHIRETFDYCFPNIFNLATKYIYLGNAYFFMVSGFLINYTYKNKILNKNINLFLFMKKRIIKLYPLYFLSNLYLLLVNIYSNGFSLAFNVNDAFEIAFLVCWGWIKNVNPYNFPCWFISVLILCYILYYLIEKLSIYNLKLYLLLIGIMVFWGGFLILKNFQLPFLYLQNGEGYLNFFTGVLLSELLLNINNKKRYLSYWVCLLFSILIISNLNFKIAISTVICPSIIILATYSKILKKILSFLPIYFIGKISMVIFFLHGPLYVSFAFLRNKLLFLSNLNMKLQLILFFIVLIFISYITNTLQNFVFNLIKQKVQRR